jgi:hypothetical protein
MLANIFTCAFNLICAPPILPTFISIKGQKTSVAALFTILPLHSNHKVVIIHRELKRFLAIDISGKRQLQ